jgi:hypothetical protein
VFGKVVMISPVCSKKKKWFWLIDKKFACCVILKHMKESSKIIIKTSLRFIFQISLQMFHIWEFKKMELDKKKYIKFSITPVLDLVFC